MVGSTYGSCTRGIWLLMPLLDRNTRRLVIDGRNMGRSEGLMLRMDAVLIGEGQLCSKLMDLFWEGDLTPYRAELHGFSDMGLDVEAVSRAREHAVFTSSDWQDLLHLEGINTVIDLRNNACRDWPAFLPKNCSWLDRHGAQLLISLAERNRECLLLNWERLTDKQAIRKHQVIIDSLPYRVMVINRNYTIDMVNQTFLDHHHFTAEEVQGKKCHQIKYGLNRPCPEAGRPCFQDLLEDGQNQYSTYVELQDENGETRYDVVTVAPIYNPLGEIVQYVEATRDVTERIRLEREVRQSNTFLNNVIQSAVDGILVVDTKGFVLLFNEGMARLTGYSRDKMHGAHLSSFYDMETARENMRKMRSNEFGPPGKLNPTSMVLKSLDGEEIPVTLSASIVEIEGKEVGSVGVFTDMREIFAIRKELDETHLQLVQSERIASVGRMAAGVAHEINNPLSIIMMAAEFLEQALAGNTEALTDVNDIISQTMRCKEIVSNLLEFSRKSTGEVTTFNLRQLVNRRLSLFTRLAAYHDITVLNHIPPDLPDLTGDEGQLEQVLTNLLNNAADAIEGLGYIVLNAVYIEDQDRIIISVTDDGPGIPPEHRPHVFDIFYTTKDIGKGTGLGLPLSKNIVELHGGSIRFECPPQGGTVFVIDLPRAAMESSDDQPVFLDMDQKNE